MDYQPPIIDSPAARIARSVFEKGDGADFDALRGVVSAGAVGSLNAECKERRARQRGAWIGSLALDGWLE